MPSKLRPGNPCGGEIVEVQGGHIVRSTGRKDRHSKVCTAKGTRDRRVRLAAHTAIQFYDVQDRLGYDRPSKAVDWLIKKAQSAIDELAQLPPWHPSDLSGQNSTFRQEESSEQSQQHLGINSDLMIANTNNCNNPTAQSSTFLPPSLDSDSIADTIKSFFPVASATSSAMEFQTFPTHNSLSRNNNPNTQDLRLSLHSFQDPTLLRPQVLLSGTPLGFDGWSEHHQHPSELSRFQRLPAWNAAGEAGYMFNLPPVLGQNQFLSQRGPLQSSNTSSIRAWMDPPPSSAMPMDHSYQQHHPLVLPIYHPSSFSGGFSEFLVPSRIQGEQEEHDGFTDNKPSSASSDSCH